MHRRYKDDGCFLKARMLPDNLSQFESVDIWHADVHQNSGHIRFEQFLESILGRGGFDQVLSQVRKNRLIAEQLARLVIDHQDVYFFFGAHQPFDNLPRPACGRIIWLRDPYTDAHRWSHIRSADNNCSVFTGFARYSEAPASKHFSRSPFIAFAVRAMMGNRRNDEFCRMTCIVA